MVNKDVTHPNMRRRIENPRIILLDCPLEYKKGESQTNAEVTDEKHWARLLEIEEEQVKQLCDSIIALKPDLVFTEKGVSVDDLKESDVGTGCGLFEVQKIGDEYFTFLTKCKDPKACTIMLRGPSKDILNEIERNLQDAMAVARNVVFEPKLCPGGGATEMAISVGLAKNSQNISGVIEQWPYKALADSFEVIPRTLIQNCGGNAIKVLTQLRAKHAQGQHTWGIDGTKGVIVDMKEYGIWDPYAVKAQTIKTAIESSCMLLRVDDVVSGMSKKTEQEPPKHAADEPEGMQLE
ncbi:GroEL equatorial domain-like protein [Piromyces finnis]|uniref:CCT-gamma n=1 Tax=Piromyces finnis TaxID=1754191 RepID=A0A1Y1UE62_9FUNG|nr:GroEL equatorial domain-like protein [Piromyces finnis]|eukprot:ORX35817.1 GroEL equatorial domain-like protein [Piromyces finnis]